MRFVIYGANTSGNSVDVDMDAEMIIETEQGSTSATKMADSGKPLVSIILTNYNYAQYLREAVDSALDQDYDRIEVLVVDDGSKDNSKEIIESFGDRIVSIFKKNGGQGTCFNLAFEQCRGDIIIFLDADDFLSPDTVSLFVDAFSDPTVAKCNGYLQIVDAAGRPSGRRLPEELSPTGDYKATTLKYGPGCYTSSFTSGNAWSRRCLEQIMPIPDANREIGSDGFLTTVDALCGKIVNLDRIIGGYRIHGKNWFPGTQFFTERSLKRILVAMEDREDYLARCAGRFGLTTEREQWEKRSWRRMIVRHAAHLFDRGIQSPPVTDFVLSPLRRPMNPLKRIVLVCTMMAIRLLPASIALELSRRTIGYKKEA